MTNELAHWCEKFGFDDNINNFIGAIEQQYKKIGEIEAMETGADGQMTMSEWIFENTNIEEFKSLTLKERFLYGLGVLSMEIMNY